MKRRQSKTLILICVMIAVLLSGCSSEVSSVSYAHESENGEANDKRSVYFPVGTYDSADTAILQSIDEVEKTVTLYNTYAGKTYTLNYDGTTYVSDKYGTDMSMSQIREGSIVNVNFLKATKQLVDMQISPDAWTYENVTQYNLNGPNSTAVVGDRTYALTDGVRVFSQGRLADIASIVAGDTISVSGLGYDIYSIRVETGHGYVSLDNDDSLIGGWIEIGNAVITRVTDNMLIAVPEGKYTALMYNDYGSFTQDITVERNRETVLDCSAIQVPEDIYGKVLFTISPSNAVLYFDGVETTNSSVVKATYGVHQIEIAAPGYNTLSKYINVGEEMAEINISLEKTKEIPSTSGNSSYGDSQNETTVAQNPFVSDPAKTSTTVSGNTVTPLPIVNTVNNNTKTEPQKTPTISGNTPAPSIPTVSGNENPTTSGNSTTSGNTTTTGGTVTSNTVTVYSPQGADIYLDSTYIGVAPVSFPKVEGAHTITMKKEGYSTSAYTILFFNDGEDMGLSFPDMTPSEVDITP